MSQLGNFLFALCISNRVVYYTPLVQSALESIVALPEGVLTALLASESSYTLRQWHTVHTVLTALQREARRAQERGLRSDRNRSSGEAPVSFARAGGVVGVLRLPSLPPALVAAAHTARLGIEHFNRAQLPQQWFEQMALDVEAQGGEIDAEAGAELIAVLDDSTRRVFDTYLSLRALSRALRLPQPEPDCMTAEGYHVDVVIDWGRPGGHRGEGAVSGAVPHVSMPHGVRGIALLIRDRQGTVGSPIEQLPAFLRENSRKTAARMGRSAEYGWIDTPLGPESSVNGLDLLDFESNGPERNAKLYALQQAGWLVIELRKQAWKDHMLGVYLPNKSKAAEPLDGRSGGGQDHDARTRAQGHHVLFPPDGGSVKAAQRLQDLIQDKLRGAGMRVQPQTRGDPRR
jgi:hypothetical protein